MPKSPVLAEMKNRGLRSSQGRPLTPQSFGALLRNPIYAGRIVVPKWDMDVRRDLEPLVSPAMFDAAQPNRDAPATKSGPHLDQPDFPLRRAVRCGVCATPLTASWSRGRNGRYPYYRCHKKGCGRVSVRKEKLEEIFVERLKCLSVRAEALRLLSAVVRDCVSERDAEADARRTKLIREQDRIRNRSNRLVDAFVHDRTIEAAVYEDQKQRLAAERSDLDRQLEALASRPNDVAATFDKASLLLADLAGYWNQVSWQDKPRLLAAMFPVGLTYIDGEIGTAENSWLFGVFPAIYGGENALAARTGFEPVPPP